MQRSSCRPFWNMYSDQSYIYNRPVMFAPGTSASHTNFYFACYLFSHRTPHNTVYFSSFPPQRLYLTTLPCTTTQHNGGKFGAHSIHPFRPRNWQILSSFYTIFQHARHENRSSNYRARRKKACLSSSMVSGGCDLPQ